MRLFNLFLVAMVLVALALFAQPAHACDYGVSAIQQYAVQQHCAPAAVVQPVVVRQRVVQQYAAPVIVQQQAYGYAAQRVVVQRQAVRQRAVVVQPVVVRQRSFLGGGFGRSAILGLNSGGVVQRGLINIAR